jgi:DNA polymerase III psi subunit
VISESQRLQYLEAMGIQAWVGRSRVLAEMVSVPEHAAEAQEFETGEAVARPVQQETQPAQSLAESIFEIGPGRGQTLLLCGSRQDASLQIASDIARSLGETPVWGWRLNSPGTEGIKLEGAIRDRLFTRVLLFTDSAGPLTGNSEVMASARIIYAPSMTALANNPQQKRALWAQLALNGWCTSQA